MSDSLLKAMLPGAALMCGVAMLPGLPYSYFMLLRVVVCAVMVLAAGRWFHTDRVALAWMCVAVAVLFNPLLKVHLTRDLWWFMDGAVAVWCLVLVKWLNPQRASD